MLLGLRLKLLTFAAPEYELEPSHGIVRWRIARWPAGRPSRSRRSRSTCRSTCGVFPTRGGRDSDTARLHVEVEVTNFHPAIVSGFGLRIYNATQARVHVLVTHGFLRSLARLDLAESRVGRFAGAESPSDSDSDSDSTPR